MKKIIFKHFIFLALIFGLFGSFSLTNKENVYVGAYRKTYSQAMISYINSARTSVGLSPVIESRRLNSATYNRAINLYNSQQWSHDGLNQAVSQVAIRANTLYGENLGEDIPNDSTLYARWMDSSSHKDNILNPRFKYAGFARYKNYAVLWLSEEY